VRLQQQLDALADGADGTVLTSQIDDIEAHTVDKTDELKDFTRQMDLLDIKGSVNSVERLRKSTKEQIAALDRKIHYV
jgi:hypothetical protein